MSNYKRLIPILYLSEIKSIMGESRFNSFEKSLDKNDKIIKGDIIVARVTKTTIDISEVIINDVEEMDKIISEI